MSSYIFICNRTNCAFYKEKRGNNCDALEVCYFEPSECAFFKEQWEQKEFAKNQRARMKVDAEYREKVQRYKK